jgi:protein-disulfide isomerase
MLAVTLLVITVCSASAAVADPQKAATAKAQPFSIPAERASGSKNAPIVIEVFSDFQCPFCRAWYLQTLTRVIEDYCSKGKVYLVHREFPIPRPDHRYSPEAARWALACSGIGKYEVVAAALFRDQETWERTGKIEATVASVLTPAELQKVKLEMTRSKEKIESALEQDIVMANQLPLAGTPAFRILKNGKVIYTAHGEATGPPPPAYNILKKYLDEQLAK